MAPYRSEGLGWLSVAFIVLGAMILIVNRLSLGFWVLSVLQAIPVLFGVMMLTCGIALVLAGFLDRSDTGLE